MEPGQAIRAGIAASAIAHLIGLLLVLLFAEVHPFGSATADPIAVDIVTSEEVPEQKPELTITIPETKPALDLPAQPTPANTPAPTAAPAAAAAASPPPTPAPSPTPADRTATAQRPSPSPGYAAPEPDLSVKYQVMLGLPADLSQDLPAGKSGDKPGGPFDSAASTPADIASSVVAEFRRHLKTCLKRPQSIAPSDKLRIKLRVFMTLEAKLASEPVLLEASASPKGPALMQGAISALQACQPYAMLPADRYGEWKVLDLSFTPQDFAG